MSSSLETDSSQGGDTPLFQYTGNGSTSGSANTAFPFNPPFMVPQRKDSSTSSSGSGPDTPESMEIRKLKQNSRGLAAMSNSLHQRNHSEHQASISIPRYFHLYVEL